MGVARMVGHITYPYFDLARQYGNGSLTRALESVTARTLLIAFSSDWLYPVGLENSDSATRPVSIR
jgi:homoserine O-acetyltransferase/O-succinyltransferase